MTTTTPSTPTPGWKVALFLLVIAGAGYMAYTYDAIGTVKTEGAAAYLRVFASKPAAPRPSVALPPTAPKVTEPVMKPTGACPPPVTVPSGLTYKPVC